MVITLTGRKEMTYIKQGYGFNVGQDFARAAQDTPIEIDPKAYSAPCDVIGYIAGNPDGTLGFLRSERVRVRVQKSGLLTR